MVSKSRLLRSTKTPEQLKIKIKIHNSYCIHILNIPHRACPPTMFGMQAPKYTQIICSDLLLMSEFLPLGIRPQKSHNLTPV